MKTLNNNLDYSAHTACVVELSLQDLRLISGGHEVAGHDAATEDYSGHDIGDYVNLFGESTAYVVGYFFSAGPTLILRTLSWIGLIL
jgi:hypothetical protein